ncbi:hypothetical protein DQG13_05610 [Paenibacillus sp. YN15]|nr:hypothetical protein DQG13_05610 [Paenibacillus sp. YN15]
MMFASPISAMQLLLRIENICSYYIHERIFVCKRKIHPRIKGAVRKVRQGESILGRKEREVVKGFLQENPLRKHTSEGKQNLANESVSRYFAKTGMKKNLTNLYRVIRRFERISAQIRTNSNTTIR